jgi:aminopeptidase N
VPLGDPAYSEVALFDVMLTTPSDFQVASTGVVLGETKNDDGTTLRTIVTGPVRDFSVAISKTFEKLTDTHDGIAVNVWSMPGRADADQAALDDTETALSAYNQQFGPYPFNELDVVESPITAGGIEYPGLIYVASNDWDTGKFFFEVVVAHETAHQWWYSMVGNDQVLEPWLDESLADYSVEIYFNAKSGPGAGRGVRESYQESLDGYLSQKGNQDMPVGLPVSAYDGQQYSVFVYQKGPLFYSQLGDKYGNEAVLKLLKTYYTQYRYRIAHTDDMRRLVTEMFGQDAQDLFDQMILGKP